MKRFLSLIALMLCIGAFSSLHAQDYTTLRFTGQGVNGSYVQLSSVEIQNITRGWEETLVYPDTILLLGNVGIEDHASISRFALSQNTPNPFKGNSDFSLQMPDPGKVNITVFDLNGKRITDLNQELPAGIHIFRVFLNTPQTYLVTAKVERHSASIKIINQGSESVNRLEYRGMSSGSISFEMGGLKNLTTGQEFQPGDLMRYVGKYIANDMEYTSDTIFQPQFGSEDFRLVFPCIPLNVFSFNATTCNTFTWNGQTYTQSGVYTQTFQAANGCDSVVTLNLTVNQPVTHSLTETVCGEYIWNGQTYTQSGVYTQTFQAANGCDSVVTLNLTVNQPVTHSVTETVCGGYVWNGVTYTQSGVYTQTFQAANGCDSVVTLNLTVNQPVAHSLTETVCGEYIWNGVTYTQSGVCTQTFQAANGCDSVVTLDLTVNQPVTHSVTETVCGSFVWNGQTYTQSGVYTQTFQAANGCDSVVTLNLTVNQPVTHSLTETICGEYAWNGITYTQSGVYTQTFQAVNGCDSVVTLNLMVNQPVTHSVTETVCGGYVWNGVTYTQSGVYTQTFQAVNGCDSVVTLNLTVNQPVTHSLTETVCGSYVWNGQTYTQSGVYTQTFQAANGCDSVVTLNLTVNQPVTHSVTETVCGSYVWNGVTYTQSGVYTQTFQAANGCDSVVTLNLTLNQSVTHSLTETVCGSFVWNGVTYTQSGVYTQTFQAVNGCDSVVTLNLTVNQPVTHSLTETVCGSYVWNGQTYTQSGVYTQTFQAANGCDSVVTLNLTVNQPVTHSVTETVCGSYTWNGLTYTQSGTYTQTFQAVNGCDSVVTLNLTVNQPVTDSISDTVNGSYEWNGQTYTESGTYTQTFTAANGCDSVVTLTLTVNNFVCGLSTVTDHEGNEYHTISIGTQCWTKENLRTTTSPSTGTYLVADPTLGMTLTGKQAFWYDNDSATYAPMNYGLLYNWNAAVDTFNTAYGELSVDTNASHSFAVTFSGHRRGICPEGWHIPTDTEWNVLTDYLGSQSQYTCDGNSNYIAKALASTTGWDISYWGCTPGSSSNMNNASGFNALPAGHSLMETLHYYDWETDELLYDTLIYFGGLGEEAFFWSASSDNSENSWLFLVSAYDYEAIQEDAYKTYSLSVRCVYDADTYNSVTLPTVSTSSVAVSSDSTAVCGGEVLSDGGVPVIARGVCWSTSQHPTIFDDHTIDGDSIGVFTSSITGLSGVRTYYMRAYATNAVGTAYGEEVSFRTVPYPEMQPCPGIPTVTDYDGNVYNTVQIGDQCWMRENLRTTHFADGTVLQESSFTPNTTGMRNYFMISVPFYYHVNANNDSDSLYGLFYNWLAVMNGTSVSDDSISEIQGICPNGWHVPSDADWHLLSNYATGQGLYQCGEDSMSVAKAFAATSGWNSCTNSCVIGNRPEDNNALGFSALPIGYVEIEDYIYGNYYDFGAGAHFWSTTELSSGLIDYEVAGNCMLNYRNANIIQSGMLKNNGLSVRCLRNNQPSVTTASVTGITDSSAICGGNVTDEGVSAVTARGVCWSTSPNPTIADNHTTDGSGTGGFTSSITGLTSGTTYYVRAYATNSAGTAYGEEVTFTTTGPVVDEKSCPGIPTLTDIDGNIYSTVKIGEQCWMKENLRTTHYSNGDIIMLRDTFSSNDVSYECRYAPNNDMNNVPTYGYLYNWAAVMHGASSSDSNPSDVQGVCPLGWHVPSDAEWTQLTDYVSSQSPYVCGTDSSFIAKALASTEGWISHNGSCTVGKDLSINNITGFGALPAGYGVPFSYFSRTASFWSSTEAHSGNAWFRKLDFNSATVDRGHYGKFCGSSVRCLRDAGNIGDTSTVSYLPFEVLIDTPCTSDTLAFPHSKEILDYCVGTDTVRFSIGNYEYGIVQWQVSRDTLEWTDITDANDTIYVFYPEESGYYRARMSYNWCPSDYSQTIHLNLIPRANAGRDRTQNAGNYIQLSGNAFEDATGQWTVLVGDSATINDPTDPKSLFMGPDSLYVLTWTLTNSCGSSTDTVTLHYIPTKFADHIVVVDTTDLILSDSISRANGIYYIVFNTPVPTIVDSTILVGIPNGGFLRRVVAFVQHGDTALMYTEQATLDDLFEEGAFNFDGDVFLNENSSSKGPETNSAYARLDHRPTRAELTSNSEYMDGRMWVYEYPTEYGFSDGSKSLDLSDMALSFDSVHGDNNKVNLIPSVSISEISFSAPKFVADFDFYKRNGQFYTYYYCGISFPYSYNLELKSSFSFTHNFYSGKDTVFTKTIVGVAKRLLAMIGSIPIEVKAELELNAELSGELSLSAQRTFKVSGSADFGIELKYEAGESTLTKSPKMKQPMSVEPIGDWSGTMSGAISVALMPKVSFKLYECLGPYAEIGPKASIKWCHDFISGNSTTKFKFGFPWKVGINMTVLKKKIFDLNFKDEIPIWKLSDPAYLERYVVPAGDYEVSEGIYHPVSFSVVSGPIPLSKVLPNKLHIQTSSGYISDFPDISLMNNSVLDLYVFSDDTINIYWRPENSSDDVNGTASGSSNSAIISVELRDCEGKHIDQSPLYYYVSTHLHSCYNSTLQLSVVNGQLQASGGEPPYVYAAEYNNFNHTSLTPLPDHTYYVRDANNCTAQYHTPPVECDLHLSHSMNGGWVLVRAENGTAPYSFYVDGSSTPIATNQSALLGIQLPNGHHTVSVTDNNECTSVVSFTINDGKSIPAVYVNPTYNTYNNVWNEVQAVVVDDGNADITERGVYYSQSPAMTSAQQIVAPLGTGTGAYVCQIPATIAQSSYYVCAYAVNEKGTAYSDTVLIAQTNEPVPVQHGQPCPGTPTVTDHEGNVYNTVQIGQQCWTKENMRCETSPSTGTYIVTNNTETYSFSGKIAKWYDNDKTSALANDYGLLYNWNAAVDTFNVAYGETSVDTTGNHSFSVTFNGHRRGICPAGWHVPTDAEWTVLTNYLSRQSQYTCGGNSDFIAKAMASTTGWETSEYDCEVGNDQSTNNTSGFSIVPAGWIVNSFREGGIDSDIWSATESGASSAYDRYLLYYREYVTRESIYGKHNCFSVRCIRSDNSGITTMLPTVTTGAVSNISNTSATCVGNVTSDGHATVTARGICWSTSSNPTISDSHTTNGSGTGSFTGSISGLVAGSTYYVRAYATNSEGTAYGDAVMFRTTCDFPLPAGDAQSCPNKPTVTDYDGNVYHTVKIGQQCWMKENMRTTHFADGTSIPLGGDNRSFTSPYYYDNSSSDVPLMQRGYFYNGPAAMHGAASSETNPSIVQGICPVGWHVPSAAEWTQLVEYMGSQSAYTCGGSTTNIANALVDGSNSNATGFSAIFAGGCKGLSLSYVGYQAQFWTTNHFEGSGWFCSMNSNDVNVYNASPDDWGRSVRCLRNDYPTVTTTAINGITDSSATCGGNVTDEGVAVVVARGICWSTAPSPTIANSHTNDGSGMGQFTSTLTGLMPGTTYYVRAYATNSEVIAYGNEVVFVTAIPATIPIVATLPVTGITDSYATCGGNVTDEGVAAVSARGVCWSTFPNPTIADNHTNDGSGAGEFTSTISGLDVGTTYYVRAYAMNSLGTEYGDEIVFITLAPPIVTTAPITDITETSAACGGNVTYNNNLIWVDPTSAYDINAAMYSFGVCWSTFPNPTVNDSHQTFGGGIGMGHFPTTITGLTPGTTYYLRAYATNSAGTGYGEEVVFTTMSVASIPTVSTAPVTNITTTSATCGGVIASDGDATVISRGVCWSTSPNPTISDNHTTDGSGIGEFTSTITGLTPSTAYYVRAYATNSEGTAYGEEMMFSTASSGPIVDEKSCPSDSILIDIDGNVYGTVKIGNQCWMRENLRTTHSADGMAILLGSDTSNTVAYYYDSGSMEIPLEERGYFYNWPAAMIACPMGWHLPSDAEWSQLADYLGSHAEFTCGGDSNSIAKALSCTSYWLEATWNTDPCSPGINQNANNVTGFSAVPAGSFNITNYPGPGAGTMFWSSTAFGWNSPISWCRLLSYQTSLGRVLYSWYFGYSVRCLRNNQPSVTTASVTGITDSSAICGGNVTDEGVAEVTARGVCWSTSPNPTISDNHTTDGNGIGEFTSTITGLTPSTTYYVRAYATNSEGTAYGEEVTFTTVVNIQGEIIVTFNDSTWVAADMLAYDYTDDGYLSIAIEKTQGCLSDFSDVFLQGYIESSVGSWTYETSGGDYLLYRDYSNLYTDEEGLIGDPGLVYWGWEVDNNSFFENITAIDLNNRTISGVFTENVFSLQDYILAGMAIPSNTLPLTVTMNNAHWTWTGFPSPSVTTSEVIDITINSAVCGGNVSAGGVTLSARGVCWSTSPNPTTADNHTTDGSGKGTFTSLITGLTPNTTYYVRAYATNNAGTAYGEEIMFTTTGEMPTVITSSASNITDTSATCGGNVVSEGVAEVTARGICWSTSPNPTIEDNHTNEGSGTGDFSVTITGLVTGTTYHVRAYATNSIGTAYGENVTFTTHFPIPVADENFCPGIPTVTDIDGNVYSTVKIGIQCWMRENMRTTKYADGTSIPAGGDNYSYTDPYYYDYYSSGIPLNERGYLYNWSAAMHETSSDNAVSPVVQGICPAGWHVPSAAEWTQLADHVSSYPEYTCGRPVSNYIAKALASTTGWELTESGCAAGNDQSVNNTSGFCAFPAGYCEYGVLSDAGLIAEIWLSSVFEEGTQALANIDYQIVDAYIGGANKQRGVSVRCLRDSSYTAFAPTLTTSDVYEITNSTAVCGGNVVDDGDARVTTRGICWSTTSGPTINDAHTNDGSGNGQFTGTILGLASGTTYYVRAYATNSVGTSYGEEKSFTTPSVISDSSFICGLSTVMDHEGNEYHTVSIGSQCWTKENLRTTTSPSTGTYFVTADTSMLSLTGKQAFWYDNDSATYASMNHGLLYNWNAAVDTFNTAYEETSADTVGSHSFPVMFSGFRRGICPEGWHIPTIAEWTTMTNYLSDRNQSYNASGFNALQAGSYSYQTICYGRWDDDEIFCETFLSFSGLGEGNLFWSSSSRDNESAWYNSLFGSESEVYMDVASKTWGASVRCVYDADTYNSVDFPTVTTSPVAVISDNVAECGGVVLSDGGAPVIERGVCWNTTQNPTVSDNHTTDANGLGAFTSTMTGLTGVSTFYVRAYATNAVGTVYGEEVRFTTVPYPEVQACSGTPTVTDYDGNVYNTVKIGGQCWTKENLRTTHYSDGTAIVEGYMIPAPDGPWSRPGDGDAPTIDAPTYYRLNGHDSVYGFLYNWSALMYGASASDNLQSEVQGICPDGWHVPSNAEWVQLLNYASNQSLYWCGNDSSSVAKALAGTLGWNSTPISCAVGNNPSANDALGFSALPAGYAETWAILDSHHQFGSYACFWSSTNSNGYFYDYFYADACRFIFDYANVSMVGFEKNDALSVRCLRNNQPTVTTASVTGITDSSAICGGNVTDEGVSAVTTRGVCWSTSPNPTVADNHTTDGCGVGEFTSSIIGLYSGTTYYVRAYATNSAGTAYGEEDSFTTWVTISEGDGQPCLGTPIVTDHEGNVYNTVKIGNQCWTKDNLRTTTSPSTGTYLIPTNNVYTFTGKQARWYNNDSAYYAPRNYGLLYNWNAAVDTFNTAYGETSVNADNNNTVSVTFNGHRRGICPVGWHLPSDAEWTELTNYVGSVQEYQCGGNSNHVAKALASEIGWNSNSGDCYPGDQSLTANNATNFSAIPAGHNESNVFVNAGYYTAFWSSSQYVSDPNYAYFRYLYYGETYVPKSSVSKLYGFSVRCLRDEGGASTHGVIFEGEGTGEGGDNNTSGGGGRD